MIRYKQVYHLWVVYITMFY